MGILSLILGMIGVGFLIAILSFVVNIGSFALWIVLLIKAFQSQQFKLPVIGDFAQLRFASDILSRRVAHCSDREDGSYHLGLSFAEEEVEYEVLPRNHEPGFSLSVDSDRSNTPDSTLA